MVPERENRYDTKPARTRLTSAPDSCNHWNNGTDRADGVLMSSPGNLSIRHGTYLNGNLGGAFTSWEQIVSHDGWKVLTDETQITKRLLQRNETQGIPHLQEGPLPRQSR